MKFLRIPALLAASALLVVSCSKQDETVVEAADTNPLLAYVPADTPYVFANLETTPPEVVEAFIARFEPFFETAQAALDDIQIEVNSKDSSEAESFLALSAALMNELDGNLNRKGFESLGFSMESYQVVYGNGAFPVFRIGLSDASALRAAVGRVETSSGQQIPEFELNGTSYWRLSHDGDEGGIYIAILADHVAISGFPVPMEASVLPGFLGQAMPETSIADSGALAELSREKGFSHFGSGYIDFQKLATEFLDPNSRTVSYLQAFTGYDPADIDPVCVAEARTIIAAAPRFVAGTTELTADAIGIRYQIEIQPTLAQALTTLVSEVPVASSDPTRLLATSLGINIGTLREFLLEKATELAASPFQCPKLAELNKQISTFAAQLNQPMPPFIGNLKGFRLVMDEMDMRDFKPQEARGMFSLEVENPQMLVGMASMMVPGFEELGIEPGSDPVQLPEELLRFATPEVDVYVVMTSDAIGLSLGKDQQAGLVDFMEASGDNNGTFFSLEYEMAASLNFQDNMVDSYTDVDNGSDNDYAVVEDIDRAREMQKDLSQAYKSMVGRTRMELRFTGDGLVIDTRMTFK